MSDLAPLSLWHGVMTPFRLTITEIADRVARKHGLTLEDLKGPDRRRKVAHARHEAMAEIRANTRHSIPRIGQFFNRDHTTVLHALKQHAKRSAGVT